MATTADQNDWRERAACRAPDVDPSLFFPPPLRVGENWDTTPAKLICATCPVVHPCLVDAIENVERYGVRGGVNMASREDRRIAEARLAAGQPVTPSRNCEECGRPFIAPLVQRLCGEACRARRARRRFHGRKAS